MDPGSLSGQFSTNEHFPRIVHIGATLDSARKVQEENDWSGVLKLHQGNFGPDNPHHFHTHGLKIGGYFGTSDDYSESMELARGHAETLAINNARRLGDAAASLNRRFGTNLDTRAMDEAGKGVIIEAVLHPSNPIESSTYYVGRPDKKAPKHSSAAQGIREVPHSSLPHNDLWIQRDNFDEVLKMTGAAIEPEEPKKRLIVTNPRTALTFRTIMGPLGVPDNYHHGGR